jgi:hypothetical protein
MSADVTDVTLSIYNVYVKAELVGAAIRTNVCQFVSSA